MKFTEIELGRGYRSWVRTVPSNRAGMFSITWDDDWEPVKQKFREAAYLNGLDEAVRVG